MSSLNFEDVLVRIYSEKADTLATTGVYTFKGKAGLHKRLVGFLFKKKFGTYPADIRSGAFRLVTKSRKTRVEKVSIGRKFMIKLPEGVKID